MGLFLRTVSGRAVTCLIAYMFAFASVYGQDYVWQIERIPAGGSATAQAGFEQGDLAFAWLDIPRMFFPVKIEAVDVLFGSKFGSVYTVVTNGAFYDHEGFPRYIVEGPTRSDGWNRSRFGVQCSECEIIFNEGPVGVAEQFLGEYIDPQDEGIIQPLRQDSCHIATSSSGCWLGYNSVYDYQSDTWLDVCPGLNGNFTFRPHFIPLCPQRIGDIDGDEDLDYSDLQIFTDFLAGPAVDQWTGNGVFVDHDNDYDVDLRDFSIFQKNFTAGANVGCPVFPMPEGALSNNGISYPSFPIQRLVTSPSAGADLSPYSVHGLQRGRFAADEVVAPAFGYVQIGIVVVGILAAIAVTLIIGPCIQTSCRLSNQTTFMQEGQILEGIEITRVLAAVELMGTWRECHNDIDDIFIAMGNLWSNPTFFENPRINRVRPEDDTSVVATRNQINNRVTIHHSWITGDHWNLAIEFCEENYPSVNPQSCPVMVLAKILIAEGQHIIRPTLTERQQDDLLEPIMEKLIQCGRYPEGLGREFKHGHGGGCGGEFVGSAEDDQFGYCTSSGRRGRLGSCQKVDR